MEHGNALLLQAAVYFAAAVIAVMAAHRLGLGSVAGYLLAGIAIGPWGLKLIEQPEAIRAFAELGVVFLLFVIGLELEPHRLWSMRTRLIGLGLSQVVGSIAVIAGVALLFGIDMRVALVAGMALSLSSTALALQPLNERGALGTQGGQATFAILLFQDIAVIPMLAALPLLGESGGWSGFSWQGIVFAVAVVVGTLVLGHFIARPVFRHIARTRLREIFTAFALLLVIGFAFLFEQAGLSMALGAFLAGVLLGLITRYGRTVLVWSWLHIPVLSFLAANILATIFAVDPLLALYGAHTRMIGLGTIADGVLLYFAIALLLRTHRELLVLAVSFLAGSAVVLAYEFVQFVGKDPFTWAFDPATRPFSTIEYSKKSGDRTSDTRIGSKPKRSLTM